MLMYGKSEMGYAEEMGISPQEAEDKFKAYFKGKPRIKQSIDKAQKDLEDTGYIEVPIGGFQRKVEEIWSKDYSKRSGALRQAFNTIVQSSSSLVSSKAVIYVNRWLKQSGLNANLMLTVHDSITISTTFEDAPKVATGAKYIMTHLPIKELQEVSYQGQPVDGFMDAEIGFGKSYGFEAEVEPEELASFHSINGFYNYYYALKLIRDKNDNHLMSDEGYAQAKAEIEANKPKYQTE